MTTYFHINYQGYSFFAEIRQLIIYVLLLLANFPVTNEGHFKCSKGDFSNFVLVINILFIFEPLKVSAYGHKVKGQGCIL